MSAQLDKNGFLQTLRESGLLSPKQMHKLMAQLPARVKPRTIARALVQAGALTKFQAEHLLVGQARGFFLGPYRILSLLGEGGMGRVYQALHRTMNRTVALKVLAPHLIKTSKARKLFQREVQAAAQLNHANIVTAYDAGEIEGRHFLAMEYVDGPTLEQLVRSQGPLPVGQASEIVRQAALGLEAAHEQSMVHRDIKPANLLLQRTKGNVDYKVKILDFGLARLNESQGETSGTIMTPENTVMGTPDFLSPEQARNLHDVDIRSDLYSLGCTFYFLLSGQVPHPGGTSLEKLVRHGNATPTPVEDLRPGLIPPVAELVRRLMAKDRSERFQTPAEVVEALEPYAESSSFVWQRPASEASIDSVVDFGFEQVSSSDSLPSAQRSGESLVGTMPPELAPTPISSVITGLSLDGPAPPASRAWIALWCTLGALLAVGLGIAAFLLLGE